MTFRPLALAVLLVAAPVSARAPAAEVTTGQAAFDWELGEWSTHVRVLTNPLSGEAPVWAEFEGTTVVRPLLSGRANFAELSVRNTNGAIEGGSLRLYNPRTGQWNVNYAGLRDGLLTAPVYGSFDAAGRGTFTGQDMLNGRAILVRFVITRPSADEAHFEQAYSADGGATWEVNWIAVDKRR